MTARQSPGYSRVSARTFDRFSNAHDHEGQVAELHWPDGRVVQISGGTADDSRGGSNITSFSTVLRADGDDWRIETLDSRKRIA